MNRRKLFRALTLGLVLLGAALLVVWPRSYVATVTLLGPSTDPFGELPPPGNYGPTADTRVVRALELARSKGGHVAVLDVTVVPPYALVTSEGRTDYGQVLYYKETGRWEPVAHKRYFIKSALIRTGVPQVVATKLVEHNHTSALIETF